MMKVFSGKLTGVFLFACMLHTSAATAQVRLPEYPDSLFTTYYHQRVTLFQSLPQTKDDIIFIGNSITDGNEWGEMFNDLRVKNRGISGDISAGVIKRINEVVKRKPAKVFLMIGVNDLARGLSPDSVVKNILLIAAYIRQESPVTKLFVQSILPVNEVYGKFGGHTSKAKQINEVNEALQKNASLAGYGFINLHKEFCDENGKLKKELTNDGLHLKGEGYLLWKHIVFPEVYGISGNPAIMPSPRQLHWTGQLFPLYACRNIVVGDSLLQNEALQLLQVFAAKGLEIGINKQTISPFIELRLVKLTGPAGNEEAYRLTAGADKILLEANTPKGIFYGIQTLKQLMRDNVYINTCEITDWPAFPWRGYMVDVGRNYQSVSQLKQQIDVMAMYKLNVFHFHATEDIAWRLESKLYPQLTSPDNMLRNKGQYYTQAEIRDLIRYCKERHILFLPEIDMPGHSGAFKRAMGTDMQSDSGVFICKSILRELCGAFDVPVVHIGGDEVKITNKNFLPEMAGLLKSLGKTVMAWDPGGNVPAGTFLQLWNGRAVPKKNYPAIDSRHLYLNHFDPLEGVSATFNHIICDTDSATEERRGATLCNWPDRRVADEKDIISMNAVFPVMLTFAERCWQGGGYKNFSSVIDTGLTNEHLDFSRFENRLMEHKQLYFKGLPFPYVPQAGIEWKLIGPFNNQGNLSAAFAPEAKTFFDNYQPDKYPSVLGGTIWLRHFWHPMIQSHLNKPTDSTTWYAVRKIWSEEAGEKDFWIGFNNLSRSPATGSPPAGGWDNRGSAVWVNGKLVEPPQWIHAGQKGNAETPLIDEGYEYRKPTRIYLRKGWNTVLIKAPVGSFSGEWQNPVKWMFTFVQLTE